MPRCLSKVTLLLIGSTFKISIAQSQYRFQHFDTKVRQGYSDNSMGCFFSVGTIIREYIVSLTKIQINKQMAGIHNFSHFSKVFKEELSVLPREYEAKSL